MTPQQTIEQAIAVIRKAMQGHLPFDEAQASFTKLRALLEEMKQQEPVRKYYYKVNDCPAESAHDPSCICWHDEGTGPMRPMPDGNYLVDMTWRNTTPPLQQREGWQWVPVEPTREMLDAYVAQNGRFHSGRSDWKAMLAAAPKPTEG